ncbi:MAG: SAM-dependent methyltransferase, partial [Terriglobia bacterium]
MGKKAPKLKVDELMLRAGLAKDQAEARARIMAGEVIINDHRADKPGDKFPIDAAIRLKEKPHNYVSRGALKLEHALATWPIDVKGAICLDVGASTGGFTQMLLNHGAKQVHAIDV